MESGGDSPWLRWGLQRVTWDSSSFFQLFCSWLMAYILKVTLQSWMLAGISMITVKFQAGIQKWGVTGTPVFFLGSACLCTVAQRNA